MSMATGDSGEHPARWRALLPAALLLLLCVAMVRTAWLSDDALITLRTVRNFLAGDGLRWNLAERVHTFSHPLWMWLLSAAIFSTREFYLTTIAAGMLTTLGAVAVAIRSAATGVATVLLLVACLASSAFVDYATSGLENPLTHLMLAALVWLHTPDGRDRPSERWQRWLGLSAGLAMFNRLDAGLLFLPALLFAWAHARSFQTLRNLALGFVPLLLWLGFSLVYFGFPFPNTAYAKLGAGLPRLELATQGLHYLRESALHDPVTLAVVALGGVATLERSSRRWLLPLWAGAALYLVYVVWIGGDFMAGRFLSAPFFLSLAALAASTTAARQWREPRALAALMALLLLGGLTRAPRTLSGPDFDRLPRIARVSDERSVYFQRFGWWSRERAGGIDPCTGMVPFAGAVSVRGSIGQRGFCEPPSHHILDRNALGDALLARLPARKKPWLTWQPGHLTRGIPAGYRESIETNENRLEDEDLRAFYQELLELTRGEPLLSQRRLASILALNTGRYSSALAQPRFALHPARSIRDLTPLAGDAQAWHWSAPDAPGFEVPRDGLELKLPAKTQATSIRILRSSGRIAGIEFLADELLLGRIDAIAASASDGENSALEIPPSAVAAGFDAVRIWPGPVKLSDMHHLRRRPDGGGPDGLLRIDRVELR